MAIYMDNSATTRVDPAVAEHVYEVMTEKYGNPSSLHNYGVTAEQYLEKVRHFLLSALGDRHGNVIFTSGGTEGNNLAIRGAAYRHVRKGAHLVTSGVEHPSVLEVFKALENEGFRVTYLPVNHQGVVDLDALESSITGETTLVSIQTVNNEVGTIQPVQEMSRRVKMHPAAAKDDILVHTDAVQAVGKMPIDINRFGVDLLTLSGHKFHAPKGIGALYTARDVKLSPLFFGGGQEGGLRPGTENVPGIVGLGKALEKILHQQDRWQDISQRKTRLVKWLTEALGEDVQVLGPPPESGAPHILYLGFREVQGEVMIHALEEKGLYVSTGSACRSNKAQTESQVLQVMGAAPEYRRGAVRLSFSIEQDEAAFQYAFNQLVSAYREVVKYS